MCFKKKKTSFIGMQKNKGHGINVFVIADIVVLQLPNIRCHWQKLITIQYINLIT